MQLSGEGPTEVFTPEQGYEEGYTFGKKLLERGEFSALFAFNDVSAIGALRAFLDAGLDVPGDMSVIGFDDIQSAAFLNPSLTTVRQPLEEMGRIAARALLDTLRGKEQPAEFSVEPELIVRRSTGPPRKRLRRVAVAAAQPLRVQS
jgi:LacI family transcriptional regulator